MASAVFENTTKYFGTAAAVRDLSLSVEDGEFFFLLGPSGCGKTTLLRLLAGFIRPDQGRVLIANQDQLGIPPDKRNVSMVFQNYALWPHMTVLENITFGLEMRGVPKDKQRSRALETLDLVRMKGFAARFPHQLSGGEQQRIAVARALASTPRVMLLDEPLSNLDPGLKAELKAELSQIQKVTKVTMVYVTHDQGEALTMAGRLAVMRAGEICQVGTPQEVYRRPNSRFVAEFLGGVNLFKVLSLERQEDVVRARTELGVVTVLLPAGGQFPAGLPAAAVRPENISVDRYPVQEGAENRFKAVVQSVEFTGATQHLHLTAGTLKIIATTNSGVSFSCGEELSLFLDPKLVFFLPAE